MALDPRLVLPTSPIAPEASVISGDGWRITVLTECLLRLEYAPGGEFEDRATQIALNRDFPTPEFTARRVGDGVQVRTPRLTLTYDGGPFSPGGLIATPTGGRGYRAVWHYGGSPEAPWGPPLNLGGTARTLDGVDGACPLEPGIMGGTGYADLPDRTLALTDDGWLDQRAGGEDLYLFMYGHDFPAALRDYYRLTGATPMLPRFALGNWWSRYYPYTQEEYLALFDRFEAERLPFSVAVLDMDWHLVDIPSRYGSGWTGYTWNTQLFPDHRAMLDELHRRGLAVTLNVHPADGIRGHEDAYAAVAERLGVDPATEEPIAFDIGDAEFLRAYLEEVNHPLEDEGIDFWWLDWQQGGATKIPGLDPLWALNHFHFLDSGRRGSRPMTFSRYAGPGSHRYPVGFSGDTVISWDSLAFQPYFTATAANIGYGWWSHDVGGHMFGARDEELITRWYQFGAFSPINRIHTTASQFAGKEPWTYNAISERVMGDFLRLRHRMLPYLYTMNERAHSAGEPLCRPIYYADPRLEALMASRNAYLFGTELLVAAITEPADRRTKRASAHTWLPEGEWVDVFTGLRYSGGREVTLHRPLEQYPVLARAGAIVPLLGDGDLGVGNPAAIELRVYAGADGDFTLYEDDDALEPTSVRTRLQWSDADGVLTIHPAEVAGPGSASAIGSVVPASRRWTLKVVGVARPDAGAEDGGPWDLQTATLTVEAGDVPTAEGATVRLDEPPRAASNREAERIREFLLGADIEFILKEALWAGIEAQPTFARRMIHLESLELDAALRGVVTEILLAHPEAEA